MKSIKSLEMQNHINSQIVIDAFQAKLGRDEDVAVIQLQSDNKDVASDLVEFIESGHDKVLDADFSPAKNEQKKYNIFIEIERNEDLPKNIVEIVRDIEKVAGIMPWQFRFHKDETFYKMNEDNLKAIVPTSADQYVFLTDNSIDEDIQTLFAESHSTVSRKGKILTVKKKWSKHRFIIESVNKPSVDGVYKIDNSSSSQADYINSWLGGTWQVVKVDDLFKITKNNNNIVVKTEEL